MILHRHPLACGRSPCMAVKDLSRASVSHVAKASLSRQRTACILSLLAHLTPVAPASTYLAINDASRVLPVGRRICWHIDAPRWTRRAHRGASHDAERTNRGQPACAASSNGATRCICTMDRDPAVDRAAGSRQRACTRSHEGPSRAQRGAASLALGASVC